MAPTEQQWKRMKATNKGGNLKSTKNVPVGVKKKKKWVPMGKTFEGSVKEGQGFAFQKKEKMRHEYNKLKRKELKKPPKTNHLYKEEYPEHLKHLYQAEAEKLRNEAWTNRVNRAKLRLTDHLNKVEGDKAAETADSGESSEAKNAASESPAPTTAPEKESLPISNRMRKRMQKKTSYQKTKEEFEEIRQKRQKKKEEYLKNKQQREEAIRRYKEKKMETFRVLSKKTKKGQPNLNLQMEYLLQKIQGSDK